MSMLKGDMLDKYRRLTVDNDERLCVGVCLCFRVSVHKVYLDDVGVTFLCTHFETKRDVNG